MLRSVCGHFQSFQSQHADRKFNHAEFVPLTTGLARCVKQFLQVKMPRISLRHPQRFGRADTVQLQPPSGHQMFEQVEGGPELTLKMFSAQRNQSLLWVLYQEGI